MSSFWRKNPYHDAGATMDECFDAGAINNSDKNELLYVYCCRNPEYGTVGFANPGDPTFWFDYMLITPEDALCFMMDIDIGDFHDHPLCEGKSEEEILSLYKELLGAYKDACASCA